MTWIHLVNAAQATGELAEAYAAMRARKMPPVYTAPHGDAPGIVRAHSLDPRLMTLVFGGMSASLAAGDTLPWPARELINTVTSRANQCFY